MAAAAIAVVLAGMLAAMRTQRSRIAVWSDPTVSWNDRGVEDAAFIIQQGLGGLPLAPNLFNEQRSRLAAFELLTGFPDPRLADWEAARHNAVLFESEGSLEMS